MKRIIKKIVAPLTVAIMLLASDISVSAAENNNVAVYDLTKGGTQTFSMKNSVGNNVLITITELFSATRGLENRSYSVSYRSLLSWEAGYNVVIYNNSISSVNSPYYICFIGSIYSAYLRKDSSVQATLSSYIKPVESIIQLA